MAISRKGFLINAACATAGASLGFLGRDQLDIKDAATPAIRNPIRPPAPLVGRPSEEPASDLPRARGEESFAQCGEDLIIAFLFRYLGIQKVTYLDVGAHHPTEINNTYFFYRQGHRGVLVEPNPEMCELLREVRPGDVTLAAGIGVAAAREADYYVMNHSALNTFSKAEADHQTRASGGTIVVKELIKLPLLSINDVMGEHFQEAPTFLSIDTEGMDLAILQSIDFTRFRPKVICAQTLISSTKKTSPEIAEFLKTKDYVTRGESFVNTIFVDSKIL